MTFYLTPKEYDVLKIIMDSEPATSKAIAESYFRCESPMGVTGIHMLCSNLENNGLLSRSKEQLEAGKKEIIVWKITEKGRSAVQEYIEPKKKAPAIEDKNCKDSSFLSTSGETAVKEISREEEPQKDITMAESPIATSSPATSETNDDHKNPSGSELQVSASSEPAVVKRELHPETVRYMSGFLETLYQVEDCVKVGRFSEAKQHLEDLLGILDPTHIIVNLDLKDANAADHLLIASDLLRGSV